MLLALWILPSGAKAAGEETPAPPAPPASSVAAELVAGAAPATLTIWNRPLATFRIAYVGSTPKERADAAANRIDSLLDELKRETIRYSPIQIGADRGIVVQSGQHILFGLLAGDLPQDGADTLESAGVQAVERVQRLVLDRSEQRSTRVLLWELVKAGVATLVAFGLWRVVQWVSNKGLARLQHFDAPRSHALEAVGLDVRPMMVWSLTVLIRLGRLALTLAIAYVWLATMLSSFPFTRLWGDKLGSYLLGTLGQLALNAAAQIPDLLTLVVILFITRTVARVVNGWFTSVANGAFTISWLSPDAARVSQRLGVAAVWLFALTVAYPYIPGSQTNVFKGATVFIGLLVSLASQGIVNQVLSGLVVVHTGALRRGDHVRIGEVTGIVVEVGMVATRINTVVQEEVTVPNAVIMTTSISNYSRHGPLGGVVNSTAISVGYDAPWRQVHGLLEEAAAGTAGVRSNPKPFVLQSALSDFYVEYRLYFHIDRPEDRPFILSRLQSAILDAFNAAGVQIMSPHYLTQPSQPVIVPRSRWFTARGGSAPDSGTGPGASS